ncbi:MAG TPA: hypothetical protein VGJ20_19895 [Xanthobacteraceae bacterium]
MSKWFAGCGNDAKTAIQTMRGFRTETASKKTWFANEKINRNRLSRDPELTSGACV